MTKYTFIFLLVLLCFACNKKISENPAISKVDNNEIIEKSDQLRFNLEGVYTGKNDTIDGSCDIEIVITKAKDAYEYSFTTDQRNIKGKVNIKSNEGTEGYYITFDGIKWSEYKGAINVEEEDEVEETDRLELPSGLTGIIYENEISIKNYGNAMNYYVQLYDCGKKYIHLVKN